MIRRLERKKQKEFAIKIEIPDLLSVLTGGDRDAYVQGIIDHVSGNEEQRNPFSSMRRKRRGSIARDVLLDYKSAKT